MSNDFLESGICPNCDNTTGFPGDICRTCGTKMVNLDDTIDEYEKEGDEEDPNRYPEEYLEDIKEDEEEENNTLY